MSSHPQITIEDSRFDNGYRGLNWRESFAFIVGILVLACTFGNFDRFPFDNEITTLEIINEFKPIELLTTAIGVYDIHPPFSYLVFQLFADIGLPFWGMRLLSLLMSGVAFLLILDLTLTSIHVKGTARLSIILLFLTFPLLYGVGDALRWYPPFALLIAGFFWTDLRGKEPAISGGVLLGLAASTNFLAIIPYMAFAIRRYVIQRRFRLRTDCSFHAVLLIFAVPGLATFISVVRDSVENGHPINHLQFSLPIQGIIGLAQVALGYFGGYRLGLVNFLFALPYLTLLAVALAALAVRPRKRDDVARSEKATHLIAIFTTMTALCVLYSLLTGFDEGRALLFLAPFMLACFALGYWSRFPDATWLPICISSLVLFGAALANARASDAPFKRNLVIPFDEVTNFITDNSLGSVLYVSNDIVSPYLMRNAHYCVMGQDEAPSCAAGGLSQFDTIVLGIDSNFQSLPHAVDIREKIDKDRTLFAQARFGYDREAGLKAKLTGVALQSWIITIEIYH